MRLYPTLLLLLFALGAGAAEPAKPAATTQTALTVATPVADAAAPATASASSAAPVHETPAARHARRTACRQKAAAGKVKKGDLNAYIHRCMAHQP